MGLDFSFLCFRSYRLKWGYLVYFEGRIMIGAVIVLGFFLNIKFFNEGSSRGF